jgi:hypothetical protein
MNSCETASKFKINNIHFTPKRNKSTKLTPPLRLSRGVIKRVGSRKPLGWFMKTTLIRTGAEGFIRQNVAMIS